jgi:hypothetical protein
VEAPDGYNFQKKAKTAPTAAGKNRGSRRGALAIADEREKD